MNDELYVTKSGILDIDELKEVRRLLKVLAPSDLLAILALLMQYQHKIRLDPKDTKEYYELDTKITQISDVARELIQEIADSMPGDGMITNPITGRKSWL